mgnify:CR=1 FL=1
MSLGYGWQANLLLDDNDTAAYSYHTYDLSLPPEEDGYDMLEDDGMIWVYAADDGSLEFDLEKESKYCSGSGVYSAKDLFHRCIFSIERLYAEDGAFPLKVGGDI